MKRLLMIAPVIALLAFAGCDLFGGSPDYTPLAVGNTWNRKSAGTMETTDATPETSWTAETRTVVVRTDTLNSGTSVFVMANVTTVHNVSPDSTWMLYDTSYVQETGTAVLTFTSKADTEGDTMLALPLAAGRSWKQGGATVTVAQQENVTVPAGTYKNCWRIDTNTGIPGTTMRAWYANKVGDVKSETITVGVAYTVTFVTELTSAIIR